MRPGFFMPGSIPGLYVLTIFKITQVCPPSHIVANQKGLNRPSNTYMSNSHGDLKEAGLRDDRFDCHGRRGADAK